ncbi:hypothetical protein ACIBKY_53460 [Nonomuraea sp. NPDC050394]|uniref:hypothetical protein n=1 Tax=Nonomuraea sp. NPDC050394 TaxID=3364363 RepID=UPI0037AF1FE4
MSELARLTSISATDALIEHLAETVRQRLAHEHPQPGGGEDLFCLNLTSYMGERMGAVLVRLREAEAAIQRVRDLHLKVESPRHGCCAPPQLCEGHAPECRGREHGLTCPTWPCPTIAALDGKP